VLQEAALGKSDPVAIVAYSALGRIFPGDPIAQPVIGFRRTLKRITREDLDTHYHRYYTPANMFAIIVGDVDAGEAAARVRSTLGALPAGGEPHAAYATPAPRLQPMYRFRTLVKQSYLLAGSLTRGESSDDAMSLELLSGVLGDGRTSRLHRRLVRDEAFTDDLLAISFQVSNTGAIAAGLAVEPARAAAARAALIEEIRRLAREPVSSEEIETARTHIRGRLARQFETNDGIADFLARRILLRQPVSREEYLARADALTPGDLLRTARRYWADEPDARVLPGPGLIEIQVLPARGFGKVIAALKFLLFRRL
jgi:zinc protease